MSESGAGNPSTHGTGGQEGANIGSKIGEFFKEGNKIGEELRGNINSLADNAFQKPSGATGSDAGAAASTHQNTATTTGSGAPAHESTGFSDDANKLGDAIKEGLNKH